MAFWIIFFQTGSFSCKRKQMNIPIKFRLFELFKALSFISKNFFCYFAVNFSKKDISLPKQDKWTWQLNSKLLNSSKLQESCKKGKFGFLDQICPKRECKFNIWSNVRTKFYLKQKISVSLMKMFQNGEVVVRS